MKKILIIDDNPGLRTGIIETLRNKGYCTTEASNGMEGIQIARKETPDLILCDIKMPGMSGYQVHEELKKEKTFRLTSFIYMTAMDERACFRRGMQNGADDFLSKPFSRKELLQVITSRFERFSVLQQHIRYKQKNRENNLRNELSDLHTQIDQCKNTEGEIITNIETLKQQITNKEHEIIKESMHIIKTNNLLKNLETQIDHKLHDEQLSELQKKILLTLKTRIKSEAMLPGKISIFQQKFTKIYPTLTSKLLQHFSCLTQYDLAVISATVAGLNTNHLADLLNVSIDSVWKSRHRLKKKLGLSKDDDLLQFIYSFHSEI